MSEGYPGHWWVYSRELQKECWYNYRTQEYVAQDGIRTHASDEAAARLIQAHGDPSLYPDQPVDQSNYRSVPGTVGQPLPRILPNSPAPLPQTAKDHRPTNLVIPMGKMNLDQPNNAVIWKGNDKITKVQSAVQVSPVDTFTVGQKTQGVTAHKSLKGTFGDNEILDPTFKKRDKPRTFFTVGKVFFILWTEPVGDNGSTVITSGITYVKLGQRVFSKVRRFIVIREGSESCSALAIFSYDGRGVAGQAQHKIPEHGIVYTGKQPPALLPGEESMQPTAIRIDPDQQHERLTAASRIHYGKVYTIEHNLKVKPLGMVNGESTGPLFQQFDKVWTNGLGVKRRPLGYAGPARRESGSRLPPISEASNPPRRQQQYERGKLVLVPDELTSRQLQALQEHGRVKDASRRDRDTTSGGVGQRETSKTRSEDSRNALDRQSARSVAEGALAYDPGAYFERVKASFLDRSYTEEDAIKYAREAARRIAAQSVTANQPRSEQTSTSYGAPRSSSDTLVGSAVVSPGPSQPPLYRTNPDSTTIAQSSSSVARTSRQEVTPSSIAIQSQATNHALETSLVERGYTAQAANRIARFVAVGWTVQDAAAVSNLVDQGMPLAAAVARIGNRNSQRPPQS